MDDSYARFINAIRFRLILDDKKPSDEQEEEEQSEKAEEKRKPKSGYDFSR